MSENGTGNGNARIALVTGGARGIGRGIAEGLAADGFRVVVADLDSAGAKEVTTGIEAEHGTGTALAIEVDVTDTAQVNDACDAVERDVGPIFALVNNAGWDDHLPFVRTQEAFWDRVIELNFKSTLRFVHRVLPLMTERGEGRIINIGSDAGRVGQSLEAVYSGAKGGVIAFTKSIAREAARSGVTANAVCPGPTRTPALDAAIEAQGDAESVLKAMVRAVPMKRLGEPADIAGAVRFFAGDHAGYVTGQTLSVSGGLTMS